jgi:hypothetical protein
MPSEEELKRVKSELYASEIRRRNMERAGTMTREMRSEGSCEGETEVDG